MENDEQCVMCHQYHQQMLMLTCMHDPCINCAALHYAEQAKGRHKYNYYSCQICKEITLLDITSIIELDGVIQERKAYQNQLKLKSNPTKILKPYHSTYENHDESRRISHQPNLKEFSRIDDKKIQEIDLLKQVDASANRPAYKGKKKICKAHGDQQITYFCFECLENICPQCAIHGKHQGHEVKQIKRAIYEIKSEYKGLIDKIEKQQTNFKKIKDIHLRTIKELTEKTKKQKQNVSQLFEKWRREIAAKEKLILKSLDELNQKNIEIVGKNIAVINAENESASLLTKSINLLLKKQELTILEEYGDSIPKIKSELQKYMIDNQNQPINGLKEKNEKELKNIISQLIELTQKLQFNTTQLDINDLGTINLTYSPISNN